MDKCTTNFAGSDGGPGPMSVETQPPINTSGNVSANVSWGKWRAKSVQISSRIRASKTFSLIKKNLITSQVSLQNLTKVRLFAGYWIIGLFLG